MAKYISLERLSYFRNKLDSIFVKQREGYGLSKNDLTDELLAKLQAAGTSSFDGKYSSLTGKPAIDGTELTATSTSTELGLETAEHASSTYALKSQIPTIATASVAGLVKPDGTSITITQDGTISATPPNLDPYALKTELPGVATTTTTGTVKIDGSTITISDGVISAKQFDPTGYVQEDDLDDYVLTETAEATYAKITQLPGKATTSQEGLVKPDGTTITIVDGTIKAELPAVATTAAAGIVKPDGTTISVTTDGTIKAELGDYAKKADVTKEIGEAKEELAGDLEDALENIEDTVKAQIGAVYVAKGSSTLAGLPTPGETNVGWVYNVSEAFVTDARFVEGASHDYPAGTNVVIVDNGSGTTHDYKFDVLAGTTDLSGYWKKSELIEVTTAEIDAMFPELEED